MLSKQILLKEFPVFVFFENRKFPQKARKTMPLLATSFLKLYLLFEGVDEIMRLQ
ncbi:hypothetical protein BSMD_009770 [Bacillus subtilis Miyagi-4]|nr:hypothetical protein BSNT_09936 [Bacillus subtilis subsp. natto BEST195]GAK79074.1 hypothetical protein BSMD_009770 [Bacillus subtilis Miyagi-4]